MSNIEIDRLLVPANTRDRNVVYKFNFKGDILREESNDKDRS
jgi:hypothetical protein